MSVFNEKGNYLLNTGDDLDYVDGIGKVQVIKHVGLYSYDKAGRLSSISSVGQRLYPLDDTRKLADWFFKANRVYTTWVDTYDYNSDGTIKSITFAQHGGYIEEVKIGASCSDMAMKIIAKEIYKYDSDGFEIWFYKGDGSRNTDRIYRVNDKERHIIKDGYFKGENGQEWYNDKWQLITETGVLSNVYYGYNKHGDLQAIAYNPQAIAAVKGIESLNKGIAYYFEYEYDSHGNWIVEKTYSIRDDEVIVYHWMERDIKYASDGFSGEEVVKQLIDNVNGLIKQKNSEQMAREEFLSRPEYPKLTEAFFEWLQSTLSYPGEETPLGSILAAHGSRLEIHISFTLNPDGTFIPPTSFQHGSYYADGNFLTWDLRNNKSYFLQTTAEKEEKKAQVQVEQILNKLLLDLKDAPAVEKGKNKIRTVFTILFNEGRIEIM